MPRRFGINAFWMKLFMAALMLLDHLYYFLPPQPLWYHQSSRVVAPMFAFLVAEGLVHTRNRGAYVRRMLLFGTAMLAGSIVLMVAFGEPISNSILISLGLSAAIITRIDRIREGRSIPLNVLYVLLLFVTCLFFEGAFLCPLMVIIFYYLRGRKILMCAVYAAGMSGLLVLTGLSGNSQLLMAFAVIPILLYNGERGPNGKFARYFFYVFYPVHIWALYLAAQLR